MENNDINPKPQPTGGLKLMTVFIAVLALHVLVIGGFTVWHLLNPATSDTDLASDKNHKSAKIASDATLSGDVSASDATATPTDKTGGASATATTTAPATDASAEATTDSSATTVPSADTANTTTPAPTTVTASTSDTLQPKPGNEPLMVSPPPADASSIAAGQSSETPSGPIQHGPVINPPENLAPPADASSTAATTPATTPIDGGAPVADGTPYTVRKGDSLARIAHRHHVALAQLKLANSLTSDRLKIGQKLVIPNRAEKLASADASEAAASPQLSSTDTVETPTEPAVAGTSVKSHHLHSHTTVAANGHHVYTVMKGDTLTKIARKFHTTSGAIMAANNITNASRLSIGKKLHIPSGESRSAAASARESEPTERETKTSAHGQLANYVP